MVTQFGMSEVLGPISVGEGDHEIFLGRELSQRREVSESTAQIVDGEIKRFLDEAYRGAEKALKENRTLLDDIANALLERETLDSEELKLLDDGKSLPPMIVRPPELPTPEEPLAVQPPAKKEESPLEGTGGEPSPALA